MDKTNPENSESPAQSAQPAKSRRIAFPKGFKWGCATSPTQAEGNIVNEWRDFVAMDGTMPDDGPGHWRKYRYDFGCISRMNLACYRFGFDWARLQPAPCAELEKDVSLRYMEMLAELRSLNIEPFLTLFHFACPPWMAKEGGWLNDKAPEWFADFVNRIVYFTDGEITNWITINEPVAYAWMAYVSGRILPGKWHRPDLFRKALANMQKAHDEAYRIIHNSQPDAQVGFSKRLNAFLPQPVWNPFKKVGGFLADAILNKRHFNRFLRSGGEKCCDFLCLNCHGPLGLNGEVHDSINGTASHIAKQIFRMSRKADVPVYLSGGGASSTNEDDRCSRLKGILSACHMAMESGADIRGYFQHSLLDCYEWDCGLKERRGLLAVDFDTSDRRRQWRPSARLYGKIAEYNGVQL